MTIKELRTQIPNLIHQIMSNYNEWFQQQTNAIKDIIEKYLDNVWLKQFNNFTITLEQEDFIDKLTSIVINFLPVLSNNLRVHKLLLGDYIYDSKDSMYTSNVNSGLATTSTDDWNASNSGAESQNTSDATSKVIDYTYFIDFFEKDLKFIFYSMSFEIVNYLQVIYV